MVSPFGLENKSIVVTGGAGGIGAEVAIGLIGMNAFPIVFDTKPFPGSELESRTNELGLRRGTDFDYQTADVSKRKEMKQLLDGYGILHGLVNNAALLGGDSQHEGTQDEVIEKVFRANGLSAIVMTQLVADHMSEGGSIVNVSSLETRLPEAGVVAYIAGKGAMEAAALSEAVRLGKKGIRVNTVSPGYVDTVANKQRYANMPEEESTKMLGKIHQRILLPDVVTPKNVSDTIIFFLSSLSNGITGQNLVVDAGFSKSRK